MRATEAKKWKSKIKSALKKAEVDPKRYEPLVETLATVLEQRDGCYEQYLADGAKPTIRYINKAGAENTVKNPILQTWLDLNTQALNYWRELGLTPSAFRKMTGNAATTEKGSALIEALKSIESS